ncbi:unnamed protein product [Candida parapsilosis]
MDYAISNLSQRVAHLEYLLSNAKVEALVSQLANLKSQFQHLLKNHPELKILISLANKYHIDRQTDGENTLSDSIKEEDLLIHYDDIMDNHRDMVEIVNMEPNSIINDINSRINETRVAKLSQMNAQHNQQIREIYKYYIMLVLKSMIVCEKYVQYVVEMNDFWLRIDQRFTKISQQMDKMEREKQALHRY